jgi:hypothetical protein
MTTILTKSSDTASSVPSSLARGSGAELAVNTEDQKLYVENASGSVVEISPALHAYPVGSIYISASHSTAQQVADALGGGTWEVFSAGRVLVGHSGSDGDFNAASATEGGAKTVTASITVPRDGWGNEQTGNQLTEPTPIGRLITGDGNEDNQNFNNLATASGDRTFTDDISTLQPYIAVYMFKRTA